MKEIRKHIYTKLRNDPTIRAATGFTAANPRVYLEFPQEEIVLSGVLSAYLILGSFGETEVPEYRRVMEAQRPDIDFSIDILATTPDIKDDLGSVIYNLFNNYFFSTVSRRILSVKYNSSGDFVEIHPDTEQITAYRKNMRFSIGLVYGH